MVLGLGLRPVGSLKARLYVQARPCTAKSLEEDTLKWGIRLSAGDGTENKAAKAWSWCRPGSEAQVTSEGTEASSWGRCSEVKKEIVGVVVVSSR